MEPNYIIVQAGGKGTRMGHLTANKPKGIVPVDNLPIIFHLFRKYPDKHFIIICDYLHEVLEKYLKVFAEVDYRCVVAEGVGTCCGFKQAFSLVPEKTPFMLIWSDLILNDAFQMPSVPGDYIGISESFECRWSLKEGKFVEERSSADGVAGCFVFQNQKDFSDVPAEGEFVRYLASKPLGFKRLSMQGSCEVGTLLAYEAKKKDYVCRPFNSMTITSTRVIKKPITDQGVELAKKESNWYRRASELGFRAIPKIYGYSPLEMKRVEGGNPFKLSLSDSEKKEVVGNAVKALSSLHSFHKEPANPRSIMECYLDKTYSRIEKIKDLVPFAQEQEISINGARYANPFFLKEKVEAWVKKIATGTKEFSFIHGDSTFSNLLVKKDLSVVLIDPRGYFGDTLLYGDPFYDWSKLYYSIVGNYDQFNAKNFVLDVHPDAISLTIGSSGYESFAPILLAGFSEEEKRKIRFLHALIWLSLSTYAWEDYDSICGAFYNGTKLLSESLKEEGLL